MTKEKKKKKDKDKDKKQKLPEPLETQRHYVLCGPDQNSHVGATSSGLVGDCIDHLRRCSTPPAAVVALHRPCQQLAGMPAAFLDPLLSLLPARIGVDQ